jgi:hypothetical protein
MPSDEKLEKLLFTMVLYRQLKMFYMIYILVNRDHETQVSEEIVDNNIYMYSTVIHS